MTPESQRIAIAEACGWKEFRWGKLNPSVLLAQFRELGGGVVPDYLNNLNAMHEAEKVLLFSQREKYHSELRRGVSSRYIVANDGVISSTAAQRAEAFLRTIGKWEE